MTETRLRNLFDRLAGRQGRVNFTRYAVTDPAIAAGVRDWIAGHKKSVSAIDAHLKEIMPLQMRINDLHYITDLDGRLTAITVCGPVPHGWNGIKELCLLKPEDAASKAAIARLPQSSRRDLNHMIGWPTFSYAYIASKNHDLVAWFNRSVRAEEQGGQIFIAVPDHRFTRKICPQIYAGIDAWIQEQKAMTSTGPAPSGYLPVARLN